MEIPTPPEFSRRWIVEHLSFCVETRTLQTDEWRGRMSPYAREWAESLLREIAPGFLGLPATARTIADLAQALEAAARRDIDAGRYHAIAATTGFAP